MTTYRVRNAFLRPSGCIMLGVEIEEYSPEKDKAFMALEDDANKWLEVTAGRIVWTEDDKISNRRILVANIPAFDFAELVGKLLIPSDGPGSDNPRSH